MCNLHLKNKVYIFKDMDSNGRLFLYVYILQSFKSVLFIELYCSSSCIVHRVVLFIELYCS